MALISLALKAVDRLVKWFTRHTSRPKSQYQSQQEPSASKGTKNFQPLAFIPLVITGITLILALLCVFAGHTTTMLQDYAVLTVNTSRIGENMVHKLENKIRSFNLDDIGLKKREDMVVFPATPTMAPTTLITMAPIVERADIGSLFSSATHHAASEIKSLESKGKGQISEATSYLHSKANSVESAVASEASSLISKIENQILKVIDDAYTGIIDDLNIKGFYNVHVMSSCKGTYQFQDGTNITVGESRPPTPSGTYSTHKHIDSCESHSAVDPMSLIRIVYWMAIIHICAAFLTAVWVVIRGCSKKLLLANLGLTLFAFIAMALASVVVHGLAVAATKVINFLGSDLGLAAYLGHKYLAMTWATVGLLALNMVVWLMIYYIEKRKISATEPDVVKEAYEREYPMRDISRPMEIHHQRFDGRPF